MCSNGALVLSARCENVLDPPLKPTQQEFGTGEAQVQTEMERGEGGGERREERERTRRDRLRGR